MIPLATNNEYVKKQNGLDPKEERCPPRDGRKRKKVLVIAGPTATGKTSLSLSIAKGIGGEIISADSMQIYRGTDIGSAKATKQQLAKVPHHLIDIRNIDEPCNVVDFYEEATNALEEILLRDRVPIIVGGAGFYVHSLLYGPPKTPPSDSEIRAKLEEDYEKFGAELLYEKLREIDPDYAASITLQDRHKIIRALEIITLSGRKVSEIPKPSEEDIPDDLDFRCWFIYYPREILYHRIEERCDRMVEEGLLDEVAMLQAKGLEKNRAAMNSIGYRQALEFFASPQTKDDYETFLRNFKKASRNYAKRQFTWFRKEPLFRWLDLNTATPERALEIIVQDIDHC